MWEGAYSTRVICSACKKPVAPGARQCPSCGRTFAVRSAPKKPAPAPEPDLLPPEPPPVRSAPPPLPSRPRRTVPLRGGGKAAQATVGGILSILVFCGFLGLRVCRVVNKVVGKDYVDVTVTIKPEDHVYGESFQVDGSFRYSLEVTALDGPVHMALSSIKGKQVAKEDAAVLLAGAEQVEKGKSRAKTGTLRSGNYAWVVISPDGEKPVRVKIKFHATEN